MTFRTSERSDYRSPMGLLFVSGERSRGAVQLSPAALFLFLSAGACTPSTNLHSAQAVSSTQENGETNGVHSRLELVDFAPSREPNPYFVLDGKPFCFAGANNYYLGYKSETAVLDVLESAKKMHLRVIRTWGFLDRGSLPERENRSSGAVKNTSEPGHKDGIYYQYWHEEEQRPAYNDGPQGLEKLDFVLHHARRLDLKVIVTLTNSWRDFGGMDQYLTWYGLGKHHLFYTDERVRKAYRAWAHHLITRVNSIDGTLYSEDPAIFAWELANEPRTTTDENFDSQTGWDTSTITNWAHEMSAYIKFLDQNHMVSVGDEGFLNENGGHFTERAEGGVDHEALTALPDIDFGTFHFYPDHWKVSPQFGNEWIERHLLIARRLDKPTILEEYGLRVERKNNTHGPVIHGKERRAIAYENYNNVLLKRGGAGALFWMLAAVDDNLRAPDADQFPSKLPPLYPDYDHFTVYPGESSAQLLSEFALRFNSSAQACTGAPGEDALPASPFVQARGVK